MSARMSRVGLQRGGPSSQRKKMVLNVDLNVLPPEHFHFADGGAFLYYPMAPEMQGDPQRSQPPPPTIDVDSLDDDVVVLDSPRALAEARNSSRRNRSATDIVNVELESETRNTANHRNKRQRIPPNQPIINVESYEIQERNNNNVNGNGRNEARLTRTVVAPTPPPPPPPPPPREPEFSCPVCMGPLVEEMSTKCGHIFCKACIKKALSVQNKCPTCRTKVTMRGTIRIYLPKT